MILNIMYTYRERQRETELKFSATFSFLIVRAVRCHRPPEASIPTHAGPVRR